MKKHYELEYQTLREESDKNKSYVFERPILILTVSLASINFGGSEYIQYIPVFITILLCFNFQFTVNRLYSAARIIAYIMLVIEKNRDPYHGWENLLVHHREFTNALGNDRIRRIKKEESTVYNSDKGYGFYSIIYVFHIFILAMTYGSLLISKAELNYFSLVLLILSFFYFTSLMIKHSISRIRKNLIHERTIMKLVINSIEDKKVIPELLNKYP